MIEVISELEALWKTDFSVIFLLWAKNLPRNGTKVVVYKKIRK